MKKCNKGFTLLEMSVVIVIMSFLLVGTMDITTGLLNASRQSDTIQKMRVIEKAIEAYITTHRRLPCPAGMFLTPQDIEYGIENCNTNATKGVKINGKILYGTIPTEELKLSKKYMYDGWSVKFLYLVVRDYAKTDNDFFIKNISNGLINNKFSYVVLSHGKNKLGAVYYDGNTESTRLVETATEGEKKNIFSMTSGNEIEEDRDARSFDDIVIAVNKETLMRELDLVDGGCVISDNISTLIDTNCGEDFYFNGNDAGYTNYYLGYRVRKYSNTVEIAVNEGVTLKKQCVVECGAYGVVNVYSLQQEK